MPKFVRLFCGYDAACDGLVEEFAGYVWHFVLYGAMSMGVRKSMAECFVQGNRAAEDGSVGRSQFAVDLELLALGIEYGQEVGEAADVDLLH